MRRKKSRGPTGNQGDGVLATILGRLEGVGLEAGES